MPKTKLILLVMPPLHIIMTMQVFYAPLLPTGGGSEDATVTYLVVRARSHFHRALGLMLMLVLMVFSVIYLRVSREEAR